ncbi:MAG: hypothetical protein JNK74_02175 [Candidatus Hydrogenedentes bacterium]|nr:hypothetical protein [Candidatus Hydrogenedentota bacterium]
MKKLLVIALALLAALPEGARAQGMMSDLLLGKLVNPEVGAYAWYSLKDQASGQEYFLRQAIVGTEKIKRKEAWWLETELVPKVGFSSVYKMLLTGPASEPDNVKRLLVREGNGAVQEITMENGGDWEDDADIPRESAGIETITLPSGEIQAEHYIVKDGEPPTEIWISEQVPPMGLVKMKNSEGELVLQRFGNGGKDGQTAIPTETVQSGETGEADEVSEAPTSESPDSDTADKEPEAPKEKKKSNISIRKRAR